MNSETICALATPSGGAIGIIRVSGSEAIRCVDTLFRAKTKKKLCEVKGGTFHYGDLLNQQGQLLDEVVVSVYKAPHSYTREDSIEISCHGSQYILKKTLQALIDVGCRQALPGEYTKRAYLNGKMDLSQAEAVDRKSTRLNSSHANISYAVFCLKKKIVAERHWNEGCKPPEVRSGHHTSELQSPQSHA